jgi:hypothetical protein
MYRRWLQLPIFTVRFSFIAAPIGKLIICGGVHADDADRARFRHPLGGPLHWLAGCILRDQVSLCEPCSGATWELFCPKVPICSAASTAGPDFGRCASTPTEPTTRSTPISLLDNRDGVLDAEADRFRARARARFDRLPTPSTTSTRPAPCSKELVTVPWPTGPAPSVSTVSPRPTSARRAPNQAVG